MVKWGRKVIINNLTDRARQKRAPTVKSQRNAQRKSSRILITKVLARFSMKASISTMCVQNDAKNLTFDQKKTRVNLLVQIKF